MASVKLVLRTNQQDKAGHCPLYIRVIKDRKAKFISAGQKLLPSEWDDAKQKVKKNHPNSARLNAYLSQKIADAEGQVADLGRKNNSISAQKLKEAIKGKESEIFFNYVEQRLEVVKKSISYSTYDKYRRCIAGFKKFIGEHELYFEDITPVLLNDYMNYHLVTLGNSNNTVTTHMKVFKTFYRDAIRENLVSATLYPFDKIKIKKDPVKLKYLTREQVDVLKKVDLQGKASAELIRDMFLFAIYAGGLRRADLISLQWKHIDLVEYRLTKRIRKTGNLHSFKLVPPSIAILNKMLPQKVDEESFVFDLVKNKGKFLEDPVYAAEEIKRIGRKITRYLDWIQKKAEIPIHITFHMSRHTFATNALNNGMRIEHVSKIMDHSSIKITEGYAKVINSELDKSMEQYIF